MYLSDIHTHSIASGHGTSCTISDMAKAASKKGLKLLGITDHGPGTLAAGTSSYFQEPYLRAEKAIWNRVIIWSRIKYSGYGGTSGSE